MYVGNGFLSVSERLSIHKKWFSLDWKRICVMLEMLSCPLGMVLRPFEMVLRPFGTVLHPFTMVLCPMRIVLYPVEMVPCPLGIVLY